MSQIITPADLANVMPSLIAEIRFTMEFASPMANIVRTYRLKSGTGNALRISQRGRIQAQHLVSGQDMSSPQKDAISQIEFTSAEAGANVLVTDEDVRRAQDDVMRAYGRELGDSIARLIDTDLILAAQGTTSADKGPGSGAKFNSAGFDIVTIARTINAMFLRPAVNINPTLNVFEQGRQPWYFVMHPFHWFDLSAAFSPTTNLWPLNGNTDQGHVLNEYTLGRFMNVNLIQDAHIPIVNPGASQSAVAFAIAQDGLCLVREKDMSIEPERDASARGTELNAVVAYGTGRYSDAWVRKLTAQMSQI